MILDRERVNAFLGGLIKVLSRFLIVPMCAICSALTPVIVIRDVDILIGYSVTCPHLGSALPA